MRRSHLWHRGAIGAAVYRGGGGSIFGQRQEAAQQGLWGKAEDLGDLPLFLPAIALGETAPAPSSSDLWSRGAHE